MSKMNELWYRLTSWENSPVLIWLSNKITNWGELIAARFIKNLGDDRTYNKTVRVLVNIGKPAIPGLIEALKCGSGEFKANAAFALAGIAEKFPGAELDRAKPVLVDVLGDEDWRARGMSARALGKIGGVSEVPLLVEVLKDDHVWPRSRAAEALGRIGDASAVPALLDSLLDGDFEVRLDSSEALEKIGPRSHDDLNALIPIARRLRAEGNDFEPVMKLYSNWSEKMNEKADALVSDKKFPVPKVRESDGFERVRKVRGLMPPGRA